MRISDWSSDVCSSDLDYLLRLPADYDDFDLGTFCKLPGTEREFGPGDAHPCGSVGCALGHGPRAGIHPVLDDDTWPDYCESQFGMQIGRATVCTPVNNAHLVCRPPLATKNTSE